MYVHSLCLDKRYLHPSVHLTPWVKAAWGRGNPKVLHVGGGHDPRGPKMAQIFWMSIERHVINVTLPVFNVAWGELFSTCPSYPWG